MDIGSLTHYLWSWNSWRYSKLFISTNGRRHLNSCSAICFYNKSILFLLGVREIGNKGGGGGDLSPPPPPHYKNTLSLTDIFHVFVKNFMFSGLIYFMFSGRISCFREEFHVFGKNFMFSGRISCFREEFRVFGKNFMFSGRISCFREEFRVFGKNFVFSGRISCFREEFRVFGKNSMFWGRISCCYMWDCLYI